MLDNHIRSVLLLTALTLVVLSFGLLLGGDQGLKAALVLALVMNLSAWWFSANLVLAQTGARLVGPEAAPELHALTAHLAERAELPMPRLAVVDDPAPNAFATGRGPGQAVVAVTTGLLNLLNREELAGVLGHELAHVKNRDILVGSLAAVLAGAVMLLADLTRFGLMFLGSGRNRGGGHPVAALLMAFLAPMAALVIQAAISRSREYLADDGGADIAGTPDGLASALDKLGRRQGQSRRSVPGAAHLYIVSPLNQRSLKNLFATHPPLEERIARLRGEII
ncbi:MAG: M48 family metalloprotease [Candidatus Adiutrix sp.]|jgi:heat shock protein HtpX|nr:M48 family metalloprotease [Candidatus Adiutrix sp.]